MKRGRYLFIPVSICFFVFLAAQITIAQAEGESCSPAGSSGCNGDTQLYCYACSEQDLTTHTYCKNGHVAGDTLWQFSQYCSTSNRQCSGGDCVANCGDGICGTYEKASDCPNDNDCVVCGDGVCSSSETDTSCSQDCSYCGGGYCSAGKVCADAATRTCCNQGEYFCSGGCSSSPCALPQCSEGAIPSSGCKCQDLNKFEGYCCYTYSNNLVWTTVPCTQTCTSIGGTCCSGAASDCTKWSNQWATDCQGYVCCTGTCIGQISHPSTPSCSAQKGNSCTSSQTCQGTRVGSGDSATCCIGTCYPPSIISPYCGDNSCNNAETSSSCPSDCVPPYQPVSNTTTSNIVPPTSITTNLPAVPIQSIVIGGQVDSHGCLISAGYSWCDTKQRCMRTWEEPCPPREEQAAFFQPAQPISCPTPMMLGTKRHACEMEGQKAIARRVGECDIVECVGGMSGLACPPQEALNRRNQECLNEGKIPIQKFAQGCKIIECVSQEAAETYCQTAAPEEFFKKCAGKPYIKTDERGCIISFDCLIRGDERSIEYEDVIEVPPEAKILSAVLKMEQLKIQFDKLQKELESLADYYAGEGNEQEAQKFYRAAQMITTAKDKVTEIEQELRNKVRQLTVQDIITAKRDIKYITQVIFRDVLYLILVGETEVEGSQGTTEEGLADCGNSKECFTKAFRTCEKVQFKPDTKTVVKVRGLDGKTCLMDAAYDTMQMECKIKDYAILDPSNPTTFIDNCKGDFVKYLKEQTATRQTAVQQAVPEPAISETEKPEKYKPVKALGSENAADKFIAEAGKLGNVVLIDFETKPDGTKLNNGDKLTGKEWESLGVTFETPSEEYLKTFGRMDPFVPLGELSLSPGFGPFESGSDTHDDLTVTFTEPVKAAGLYILDIGETNAQESITFYDSKGNVLEKISPWPPATFGNPAPGTFVSLVKDGIAKIVLDENTQDSDDVAYDNLYFVR